MFATSKNSHYRRRHHHRYSKREETETTKKWIKYNTLHIFDSSAAFLEFDFFCLLIKSSLQSQQRCVLASDARCLCIICWRAIYLRRCLHKYVKLLGENVRSLLPSFPFFFCSTSLRLNGIESKKFPFRFFKCILLIIIITSSVSEKNDSVCEKNWMHFYTHFCI